MEKYHKIINLIKRTNNQPVLFHMLHSQLVFVCRTTRYIPDPSLDFWSKVILASAIDNKITHRPLETKIFEYLKSTRIKEREEEKFKLKIVLYYLDSRLLSQLNTFILFELIAYHYNVSPITDHLIDSIVTRHSLSSHFNLKNVKKLHKEGIEKFLKANPNFSFKRLPIYVLFNIEPPVVEYNPSCNLLEIRIIESLSFYATYTENTEYFKSIIPQVEDFVKSFKRFVTDDLEFINEDVFEIDISKLASGRDDSKQEFFYVIKNEFSKAIDKNKWKRDVLEYIENLNV